MRLKTVVMLLCTLSFVQSDVCAQMIKAVKKKDDPPAKPVKKNTKPIARIKDDDEPETAQPTAFAFLTIRANKNAKVTVTVNDTAIGTVRAASSKKIPLENGSTLNISLNDGMGNTHDTLIGIDDLDQGKNIVFSFPEIDYDAIKAEALRLKKEEDDRLREIRLAEQKRIRDLQILEMSGVETIVKGLSDVLAQTKNLVAQDTAQIRMGEKDFDDETRNRLAQYISASRTMQDSLQSYTAKAVIYDYKTQAIEYIKNLTDKPDEKACFRILSFFRKKQNETFKSECCSSF
jgi:hypothetical protein